MVTTRQKRFTLAEARDIGEKLGIDWTAFEVKQFCQGMNAELKDGVYNPMTHFPTNDPIVIGKVVRTHLNESPDYYTQWAAVETAAAANHST